MGDLLEYNDADHEEQNAMEEAVPNVTARKRLKREIRNLVVALPVPVVVVSPTPELNLNRLVR
jgi:hypothetical protein